MTATTELLDRTAAKPPPIQWPEVRQSTPRYRVEFKRLRPLWQDVASSTMRVLLDPVLFWLQFGTYESEPIHFHRWQVRDLHDYSRLRAREKAPQIGFSWIRALEELHESLLFMDHTASFVSVDQREAQEKVLYARKAYTELPEVLQAALPLVTDSKDELAIGNTRDDLSRASRMLSIPATAALRGRRTCVVLDEADFYKDGGVEMLRAGLGRILKGGRLSMGSTCWGMGTVLDTIMTRNNPDDEELTEELKRLLDAARDFSIARYPWSVVLDEVGADVDAVLMAMRNLPPEQAEEEYACVRGGNIGDAFPAELVRGQTHTEQAIPPDVWSPMSKEQVAALDVGKSRNPSVYTVFENVDGGRRWRQTVLYELRNDEDKVMSLPDQAKFLEAQLGTWPTLRVVVDAIGVGAHIAQALQEKFGEDRVIAMQAGSKPDGLPPMDKREMATEFKRLLESNALELAPDLEQAKQLRRTQIASTGVVQPGPRKKTHYDRFWADAYAVYGIGAGDDSSPYNERDLVIIG